MNPPETDNEIDEFLVAYLDGQLASEQSEQLESQLAKDPTVRQRLQDLDRVWNALDVLPRSTASPAFTRSTVEMAAVSASRPASAAAGGHKLRRLPVGLLAGLVGVAIGAVMAYAIAGAPQRRALRDLPVAMHAEALESVGTMDFLTGLEEQAGKSMQPFLSDTVRSEAARWNQTVAMTVSERRGWLADQPPDDLAEINTAADRFDDRTSAQRQSLKALDGELAADDRADSLREIALAYHSAASLLTPSEQAKVRQMEPSDRLRTFQKNADRLARERALRLTIDQRASLRAAIERLVESPAFERDLERMPGPAWEGRRKRTAEQRPQLVVYGVTRFVARPPRPEGLGRRLPTDRREQFENGMARFESKVVEPITSMWRGWVEQLEVALPESTRQVLRDAAVRGESQRARLWERLLREAAPEDLGDAFVDLPEKDVEQLLLLPREQFTTELGQQDESDLDFARLMRGWDRPPDGPPRFDRRGGRGRSEGGPPRGRGPGDRPPPPPPRGGR